MAINVQLGANAGPAINAINQTANALGGLPGPANAASNALNNLNNTAGQTRNRLNNIPPAGNSAANGLNNLGNSANRTRNQLNNLNNSNNQAVNSLTNLSRVVQDAPFGFLGIANNLNPLLESFQRLRVSTGSAGGALRALGQQLIGPAGIGIALSVVSSLLIVFGDNIFGAGKKIRDAAIANETFIQSLADMSDGLKRLRGDLDFGVEIAKLNLQLSGLDGAALDIADAQNKIAANNRDISATTNKITPLVKEYNDLQKAAFSVVNEYESLKVLASEPEKRVLENAEEQQRFIAQIKAKDRVKDIKNIAVAYDQFFKTGAVGAETLEALSKTERIQVDRLVELGKVVKTEGDNIIKSQRENQKLQLQVGIAEIKLNEERVKKAQEAAKKIEEANRGILQRAKELKDFFEGQVVAPAFNIFSSPEEQLADAKKFINDINNRLANVTAIRVPLIPVPQNGPGDLSIANSINNDTLNRFNEAKKGIDKLKQGFIQTGQAISSFITPAINQMIDAIRQGESVFRAFGQAIVNIFTSVIQKLIQTAIIAGIISLISGGIGNAANGGMNFAQAFKSQFGGFRAAGGPVTAGRGYIVGENGPEWFQPQTNGSIVSNSQLNSGIASTSGIGSVSVVVRGNLRGDTIRLQQARTGRRQGRIA